MPDRAVVEDFLKAPGVLQARGITPLQPRALVAISEDRQWLMAHAGEPDKQSGDELWNIYQWDVSLGIHDCVDILIDDTGQDAHEVLADFLRDRQ